jgi:hypothetical protein
MLLNASLPEMADLFKIRVEDDPIVNPQARESAYQWAGDRVEIVLYDRTSEVQPQADTNGIYTFPAGTARQAIVTNVSRVGAYRSAVIWRKVSGFANVIVPNIEQKVTVSARLRMSVWAFGAPLTKPVLSSGRDIELDANLLALLRDAGIDDLSLVNTIAWDQRSKSTDPAKPPRWNSAFRPRGSADQREPYLRKLIDALHKMGVQVLAGYELVRKTGGGQREYPTDFAAWLLKASPSEIDAYARLIYAFFDSKGLDIDGIGYDFEFDELKEVHRSKLGLLYQKTSDAIAHRNGIVTYANAPFVEDGKHDFGFMRAQPFGLANAGLNLIARPMCYNGGGSVDVSVIKASIACALKHPINPRDANDIRPGTGLHPSQVQFGIMAANIDGGVQKLCSDLLRPNRIGLILYNLPPEKGSENFLKKCREWNEALNPGEGPPGQEGLPLQVPRGFGGWPPPSKLKI